VKNEADVIEYSLQESSKWADKIFVYDNGSSDGTWEIIKNLANVNQVIIPWKSESKPFRDGLRAEIFNNFRSFAKNGDWWCCRMDSDEFYIDNPRKILSKVPKNYHVVTSMHFEYKLTFEDLNEYQFVGKFPKDMDHLKYYSKKITSETRFFKHRDRLQWPTEMGYPKHKGIIWSEKIRIKHYQYRSPDQIQKRLAVRRQATLEGYKHFKRDDKLDWKEKLISRTELIRETPKFQVGYIQDPNRIPWHRLFLRKLLHFLKIYP